MLFRTYRRGAVYMNLDNRRLREIQRELKIYRKRLNESEKESDRQIYTGKIESLEREEKQILERCDVII